MPTKIRITAGNITLDGELLVAYQGRSEKVQDLSELHIALEARPAYVLCDNFPLADLELAVKIRDGWPGEGRPEIEASGNVTLDTVAAVAATGVDRISVGALTHSAPALDLSMRIEA